MCKQGNGGYKKAVHLLVVSAKGMERGKIVGRR